MTVRDSRQQELAFSNETSSGCHGRADGDAPLARVRPTHERVIGRQTSCRDRPRGKAPCGIVGHPHGARIATTGMPVPSLVVRSTLCGVRPTGSRDPPVEQCGS